MLNLLFLELVIWVWNFYQYWNFTRWSKLYDYETLWFL